jgi:hypothetical protein
MRVTNSGGIEIENSRCSFFSMEMKTAVNRSKLAPEFPKLVTLDPE